MIYTLNDAIDVLKPLLEKDELVIFAGSGMSRDSGLPTWDGLLESFMDMAENLPLKNTEDQTELKSIISDARKNKENNTFDPIRVATVLKNKLSECNIENTPLANVMYDGWLKDVFVTNKIPNINHELIIKTDYPFILTSNYDQLFENAALDSGFFELAHRAFTFKQEVETMSAIYKQKPSIIHVHGSVDKLSIDEIIFTKEDYNKIILKKYEGFSFALRMIFTRYSTLFVGYGASDPHLEEVMEELSEYFPLAKDDQHPLPHSFLVTKETRADKIFEKWKDRVRTDLIQIEKHSDYKILLEELQKAKPR